MITAFDALTPISEYWLGYFHADGSIVEDGRASFTQKDRNVVEAFKEFTSISNKISVFNYPTSKGIQVGHRIISTKFTEKLKEYGIKKTPIDYLYKSKHFWRGIVDGDGCVSIYNGYPRIDTCGNIHDMSIMADYIGNLFRDNPPKLRIKGNIAYCCLGSQKAKLFGEYLYKNEYSANKQKRESALFPDWSIKRYSPTRLYLS